MSSPESKSSLPVQPPLQWSLSVDILARDNETWTSSKRTIGELKQLSETTSLELVIFLPSNGLSPPIESMISIPPSFWSQFSIPSSFLSQFITKPLEQPQVVEEATGFFGHDNHTDSNDKLVRSCSWFRFMIKSAQRKENAGVLGFSYQWHKVSVFTFWSKDVKAILCFALPPTLQKSLKESLLAKVPEISEDPYYLHATFVEEITKLFHTSLWSWRDLVRDVEKARENTQVHSGSIMHELSRHVIHSSETLSSANYVLQQMIEQHDSLTKEHPGTTADAKSSARKVKSSLQFQLSILNCIELRSKALEQRMRNEINLAFNTIVLADNATMKAISLLGLVFLPGTYICAIFNASFFNFTPASDGQPETWSMSGKFWVYWALTIPVTTLTILLWRVWLRISSLNKGN